LGQILVRGSNNHAIDLGVLRGEKGGRRESIVRLKFHPGPNHDAGGGKDFFKDRELRPQVGLNTFAGLVTGPEIVAIGLNDLIGCHGQMGGAFLDHAEHRSQDPAYRSDLTSLRVPRRGERVKVTKQLVRAVYKMDVQGDLLVERRNTARLGSRIKRLR